MKRTFQATSPTSTREVIYVSDIYQHPEFYDLEHADAQPDVRFFCRMAEKLKPRRILDLGCGTGRVTFPLASVAEAWKGSVVGLDQEKAMLDAARDKRGAERIDWIEGDFMQWRSEAPFDLILSACSSLSHLLETHEQLAAWQSARANLAAGGHFIVAELMADLGVLADSMQNPPRVRVELDTDHSAAQRQRLIRYKATRYWAEAQRAEVRFLYDHFDGTPTAARRVSDYDCHVYFPNEMRLLFLTTGFTDLTTWGDYNGAPLDHSSRNLIMRGRRVE